VCALKKNIQKLTRKPGVREEKKERETVGEKKKGREEVKQEAWR
jgi:hypothetical protein